MVDMRIFSRSSHPDIFCKKDALKYLAKLTKKHLYRSLFLKKVAGCRPTTLFKKRLMHRCFAVNFLKLFRTAFLEYTCESLSSLIDYLETLTINYDLRKCPKILTIIVDFTENIWNFGVAMKQPDLEHLEHDITWKSCYP